MDMSTKDLVRIMKALANETRLDLYLEIARQQEANFEAGPGCLITEIKDLFNIGAPTMSHHLKELSNAGLITTEKRGKHLVARINNQAITQVEQVMQLVKTMV